MTLGAPDFERLPDVVRDGIRQLVALFFDKPPKGARTNFGLEALHHWAAMLTNTRNPRGWARFYPPAADLWSALAGSGVNPGLVGWIGTWGLGDGMERGVYAQFLDEAADILGRPGPASGGRWVPRQPRGLARADEGRDSRPRPGPARGPRARPSASRTVRRAR